MQQPPTFVGDNYFCESGNPLNSFVNTNELEYTDDPLWDGEGQCCSGNTTAPWFNVKLLEFPANIYKYVFAHVKKLTMKTLLLD